MRNTLTLLIIIIISLTSCRSAFEFSMLQPKNEISVKLPSLEPVTYISTLENAYSKGQSISIGSAYATGTLGGAIAVGSALTTNFADKRVNDALVIFERDVKENISTYVGAKKGSISLKITNSNYVVKSKIGAFFGAWLGTTALLYIPIYPKMTASENVGAITATAFAVPLITGLIYPAIFKPSATENIEIEVEVLNLKGSVIGRYIGLGTGTYKSTMYKFPSDVQRVVNSEALKNALQAIKKKIDNDSSRLNMELK